MARRIQLIVLAVATLLTITARTFPKKTVVFALCGILSFNAAICYGYLEQSSKASAALSSANIDPTAIVTNDKKGVDQNRNPGSDIPVPRSRFHNDLLNGIIAERVPKPIGNEAPIVRSANDFFPTDSSLPGVPFTPKQYSSVDDPQKNFVAVLPESVLPSPSLTSPEDITEIPRIRKPELELPADFRIVSQMPFSSGRREIQFISPSTGTEQIYLTSLPDAGKFELFGIEYRKVSGLDLEPLLVGKNIQISPTEIKSALKEFKILFKDNTLSKVILADKTTAEFSSSHAVIKSSKGQELERIPLRQTSLPSRDMIIGQANFNTKELIKSNKTNLSDTNFLAQSTSSPCKNSTNSSLQSASGTISQWKESLGASNSKYPILASAALSYGTTSLQSSNLSKELQETICRPPVQCNEQVISGGSEIRTDLFQVSQGAERKVTLEYEFFQIPDRLEMKFDRKRVTEIGPTSGHATQTFSFPNGAKYVGVKLTGNQEIKTTEWWYKVSCSDSELGIDRWWATAGSDQDIAVVWTVKVPNDGNYKLDIDIENLNSWDLTSTATVTVDSNTSKFQFDGVANLGYLKKGVHKLKINSFKVPDNPIVEEITFQLNGSSPVEDLVALFIADHNDPKNATAYADVYYRKLVSKYAPILYFDDGNMDTVVPKLAQLRGNTRGAERFSASYDANQIWQEKRKQQESQIRGHSEHSVDLSSYETEAGKTQNVIYATVLVNPNEGEIAINYYFHYPRSNWGEHGGFNTHEGDWEGVTVFLSANGESPLRVAFAQHVELGALGLFDSTVQGDGGQIVQWDGVEREADRPRVYVGLGGHASYPYSGITAWAIPDQGNLPTFYEFHRGKLSKQKDVIVEYLPRAGSGQAPEWLSYSGYWGRQDIGGRGHDDGPRGPMFLDTFDKAFTRRKYSGRGERWLDPWDWSSSFDNISRKP